MTSSRIIMLLAAAAAGWTSLDAHAAEVAKAVLDADRAGENLLAPDAWRPWKTGFTRDGNLLVCDNGTDAAAERGAGQSIELNQTRPEPVVATAFSRAEGVTGSPDSNYSVYLDLSFTDGTHLWGQSAPFSTGTHTWQRRQVVVVPDKPIKQVSLHLLLRGHGGKAWFRDPELQVVRTPNGAAIFDGVAVVAQGAAREGFQLRDVAAGSDFFHVERDALGLKLDCRRTQEHGAQFFDVTLSDTTGKDRAVTLVYTVPVSGDGLRWLDDPRRSTPVEPQREYLGTARFHAGANGRLSRYPFGAVATGGSGVGVGIDMARPGFFRVGYNAAVGELFLAYDVGLAPEKPSATLRFCRFEFDAAWDFRGALARYYEVFPEAFRCRASEQGIWMPFAKISEVAGWEDFGFKFKEGHNETPWDDAHGIVTFRYTEPMTWWMRMPSETPRTMEAALTQARRLADQKDDPLAKALFTSGFHDEDGRIPARLRDTPWCDGAVWSMNSMPGVAGEATHFKSKWSPAIRQRYYGPKRSGDLDGEYIDSSEGYVTDELDFRRDHFATADTPLVFSPHTHRPAIFRGMVAFEYVRAMADEVHGMGKLMMANSTPIRLCWLAPMLDVLGTETDWHRNGRWRPMSDADLLYRRAMCAQKPFCFLMNTRFEEFSHELVERYMKRCLAYGTYPGFFSHNASQGQYFTRPEFYNRDRPLFKKYVPLCKRVGEAGWEPITLARSGDEHVYVERFGTQYLTVLNDSPDKRTATITLEGLAPASSRDLVTGRSVAWRDGKTTVTLEAEDVAVIELD